MDLKFKDVTITGNIKIYEIAEAFAVMNSDQQAVVLREFFDSIKHNCKNDFKYETQLCWIAHSIRERGFKDELEYVFNSLDYFLKNETERGEL